MGFEVSAKSYIGILAPVFESTKRARMKANDQCNEQQQKWRINQETKIFKYLHNPTHLKEMLSKIQIIYKCEKFGYKFPS